MSGTQNMNFGSLGGNIVVLGVFDGVHLGHQMLIKEGVERKKESGLPLLAVTFHPHPKALVLDGEAYRRLLTPVLERRLLLEELGVDRFISIPFTHEFSRLLPSKFVEEFLVKTFDVKKVLCGFDFNFGFKGQGKPEDLMSLGRVFGFDVKVLSPCQVDGAPVSSTRVRCLLKEGDMKSACALLGYPYTLTGIVVRGDGRGRTLGFPTANINVDGDKLLPSNGVYAAISKVVLGGKVQVLPSILNIGVRPTFLGQDVRVESHIPDFTGDLYGKTMQVMVVEKLRGEIAFGNLEDLKSQIRKDIFEAKGCLTQDGVPFNLTAAYDRILTSRLP